MTDASAAGSPALSGPGDDDPYRAAGVEIASILRAAHTAAREITRKAEEDAGRIRSGVEPTVTGPRAGESSLEDRLASVRDLIARIERDREDLLRAAAEAATWAKDLVPDDGETG